ncbi:hypothetical protein Aph02nite_82910 [Actinoplanes philippinensis]|uniref:DUF1330 domain-containing protein n=1 Tax=Actinoplanes philippinensis TaxID=35752 RepID=A0A1I2MLZ9_9ACTN|nr:hypothetical protein [Actinoplanes philippinensis]GIE82341.1 hypothetical protein Aph02nite_82910 [Actinoplanes philippinensis]SFF92534.1 hypothetical protein SAMN05421541_13149 [Actinoplanes philippinensis]
MTIQLCVLLWARPGRADAMAAYEDTVLALLGEHDGRLLQRARTAPGAPDGVPDETQLIEFAGQAGFDGFLADPRRAALSSERDAAIARTELYPVTLDRA